MIKKVIFLVLVSAFSLGAIAQQSKEELQRKQQALLREIGDLNKTLKSIRASKTKSLANYNLVKRKIEAREELIQNINRDLRILDDNIYLSQVEINKLRRELDTLKGEYAKSLVFAYKNRSNYDYLNFIFSASTFNDAIKRITYLKSYRQYREQQVTNIEKTHALIENKIAGLNNTKNQKSLALKDQNVQLKDLEEDRKEQNDVVTKLKGQEQELAVQIKRRDNERRAMSRAIAASIKREQAEARKRALELANRKAEDERKRRAAQAANNAARPNTSSEPTEGVATTKKSSTRTYSPFESTDEGRAQSLNFEGNRGRLPWPVDAGVVSIPFGSYNVPGSKIRGQSDGITIALPTGSSVKAVADGEVSSVFDLGGEQAVLIRHGKYFTTYSHLSSSNVNRGQQVRAGTVVGRAAANEEGEGEVLFMVTNEKGGPLNPQSWLRGR
ncbi:MAG: peptidoglycan DD-metalloendopeptidase family protein [Segetibacter sp.]|nr:peptidoglycan DD-metalloendopeptidase family protein [Segetibacter sp.]